MPALMLTLPTPVAESWDWQLAAACRDADPTVFFYLDNERGEPRANRVRAAKRICRRCPVRARCLNYALDARETHGIWGGYTEDERRKLRRLRAGGTHQHPPSSGAEYRPLSPSGCDMAASDPFDAS
ncbi:WhiB family transcriptional regulator [Rhodococcus koreensis]